MKKIGKLFFFALFASLCLAACSDDDDPVLEPLSKPNVANTAVTVSSLTFQWDEIAGASQYAYELTSEALDEPKGGVISETTLTFSGLKDDTDYTLIVWAYAPALSDKNSASQKVEITMHTPKILPLDMPEGLSATQDGANIVVTWNAVPNVGVYVYSYQKEGATEAVEGTTEECSLSLSGLSVGNYTFTLYADTEAEEYSASPSAQASFSRIRVKEWETQGTYTATTGSSWTATVEGYDDGSYVIRRFYGVDGYDLEFIPADGLANIVGSSSAGGHVYTGTNDNYYYFIFYKDLEDYESTFEGGGEETGKLTIVGYKGGIWLDGEETYEVFEWGKTVSWSAGGNYSLSDTEVAGNATLVAYSDGSYTLQGFCGVRGYDLEFVVSSSSATITNMDDYSYVETGLEGDMYLGYGSVAWREGSLTISNAYYNNAYRTYCFTYGGGNSLTMSDLIGSYTEACSGYQSINSSMNGDFEYTDRAVTIEQGEEENTVVVKGLFENWYGYGETDLTGTVDLSARTITFEPQLVMYYYTFADDSSAEAQVVATIGTDGIITIPNWEVWYYYESYSAWYAYVYGAYEYDNGVSAYVYTGIESILTKAE